MDADKYMWVCLNVVILNLWIFYIWGVLTVIQEVLNKVIQWINYLDLQEDKIHLKNKWNGLQGHRTGQRKNTIKDLDKWTIQTYNLKLQDNWTSQDKYNGWEYTWTTSKQKQFCEQLVNMMIQ